MSSHKSRLRKLENWSGKRPQRFVLTNLGARDPAQRVEMTEAERRAIIESDPDHEIIFIDVVYENEKPQPEE